MSHGSFQLSGVLSWVVLTSYAARHMIGYFFHGSVGAIRYEVSGIWFHLCLLYPMSLVTNFVGEQWAIIIVISVREQRGARKA